MIPRTVLIRIIAAAYAAALFIVAAFLLFRVVHKNDSLGELKDFGGVIDGRLNEGGYLRPNINEWIRGSAKNVKVRWITNSKGFKNTEEFSRDPAPGTLRILYIGDSFVVGYRLNHEDASGYVMEKILKGRLPLGGFRKAEVLVAGASDPYVALEYYEKFGRYYKPYMVVLGICAGNDITQTGYREYLRTTAGPGEKDSFGYESKTVLPLFVESFGKVILPDGAYTAKGKKLSAFADAYLQVGLYYKPPMQEAVLFINNFKAVLERLRDACNSEGAAFLAVMFPAREQIYPSIFKTQCADFGVDSNAFDLLRVNRELAEFCTKYRIAFLNLTRPFIEFSYQHKGYLYIEGKDMHWNAEGNKLAATLIADCIIHYIARQSGE